MPTMKRIVCLANSRKYNERCIAGRELLRGDPVRWIRPVGNREHEEVFASERQYVDRSEPQVLDIIEMSLLKPEPKGYQQENWLFDPKVRWRRVDRWPKRDLLRLIDPVTPLWIDGYSTYNGLYDKVPLEYFGDIRSSLRFIQVNQFKLSVVNPGKEFDNDKRRVQGWFKFNGREYRLWVTDPGYEHAYLARPDGTYHLGESCLTISLGEPYKDACYKLIAAIIPLNEDVLA